MPNTPAPDDEFDYVVVGAGAAGCVVASELSADPTSSVCVLEAGPSDRHMMIHVPAGFVKMLANPHYTWQFTSQPGSHTAGRPITLTQGRTLGGSTSLNGMVVNRGQKRDFDLWAELGNQGWGYNDVLPFFRKLEHRPGGDQAFRGTGGALKVSDTRWRDAAVIAFVEGSVAAGIKLNSDYNGADQPGIGYTQASIYKRRRMSAAAAFLKPAMRRANLSVRTEAAATRILFEGKHAVGVEYRQGGTTRNVRARREVIISSGTINTARLLQISGIGDPDWLAPLGAALVHALPGVGRNFRDHYLLNVSADGHNFVSINQHATGPRLWWQIARWLAGQPSILELTPPLVNFFVDSGADPGHADIQGIFVSASKRFGGGQKLDLGNGMTCGFWQHRPESVGFVRAQSMDIADQPIIQPNYLDHETDRQVAMAAGRKARTLLKSPQMSRFYVKETRPGPDVQTDDEWLAYMEQTGTSAYHPVGTASMGPVDNPSSVVDHRLRVHGLGGLRVADASVMPRMLSANTQTTTMMIGMKAASMIREDQGK